MNERVKKGLFKGLHIASIVLICIIFAVGIVMMTMVFSKSSDGVPRMLGVAALDIRTESMEGGETPLYAGDLVFVREVKDAGALKVGDIITFWDRDIVDGHPVLNTHQIIAVELAGEIFTTRGTNPAIAEEDVQHVYSADIVGVYSAAWRGMGYVVRFLSGGWGFFLCIILPLILFFGYRVFVLIRVILEMKREKEASPEDYEDLKKELEELRAKVAAQDAPEEDRQK